MIGSQGASIGGITPNAAWVEPKCAAALAVSASSPPTDWTASTASRIEPPIAKMNWNRSVTITPQRPANTLYSAVTPNRKIAAFQGSMFRLICRMVTIARVTHPMMIRLMGRAR